MTQTAKSHGRQTTSPPSVMTSSSHHQSCHLSSVITKSTDGTPCTMQTMPRLSSSRPSLSMCSYISDDYISDGHSFNASAPSVPSFPGRESTDGIPHLPSSLICESR